MFNIRLDKTVRHLALMFDIILTNKLFKLHNLFLKKKDIITHLCFVAIYSFPPFFPHLKCFARFYYLRQEELLFNKQKQHLTMAISSTDSTPTKRKKSKRQI